MTRFLKYITSKKSHELRKNHLKAWVLLSLIAERARRDDDHFDGLQVGDAIVGDYEEIGLTRKEYRTALKKLVDFGFIEILSNGKDFENIKKRAIKRAINGTLVNLIDSSIWDINPEKNETERANEGPTRGHKQELNKKEDIERKLTKERNPKMGVPSQYLSSSFSEFSLCDQKKEEVKAFDEMCRKMGYTFKPHTMVRWFSHHPNDRIRANFEILRNSKNILSPEAWLSKALEKDFASTPAIVAKNKNLVESYKKFLRWNDLKSYENFVTDSQTHKDFSYTQKNFAEALLKEFERKGMTTSKKVNELLLEAIQLNEEYKKINLNYQHKLYSQTQNTDINAFIEQYDDIYNKNLYLIPAGKMLVWKNNVFQEIMFNQTNFYDDKKLHFDYNPLSIRYLERKEELVLK